MKIANKALLIVTLLFTLCSCLTVRKIDKDINTIRVSSDSFEQGGLISPSFTCDCRDQSPHISWDTVPEGTKSLIVLSYDKDIPWRGLTFFTWIHWLVYNIPPEVRELDENLPKQKELDRGIKQGVTTFKTHGYGGPCPPFGKHRYFFRVIAVDKIIDLPPDELTWKVLKKEIKDHVLAEGEIYGIYSRQKRR